MWYVHNERILQHASAAHIPIWITYYDRVLNQDTYLEEAGAAFRFVGLNLTTSDLTGLRDRAVRIQMNHNPEHVETYPPDVQALWNTLRQRHADQFA